MLSAYNKYFKQHEWAIVLSRETNQQITSKYEMDTFWIIPVSERRPGIQTYTLRVKDGSNKPTKM